METIKPHQQVLNKCIGLIARVKELYGIDLSSAKISFDLKGTCAGWAYWKTVNGHTTYGMKFNYDIISRGDEVALRDMIDNTAPHEVAHLVAFVNPSLGRNHDAGWVRICRALGGSGKRTHNTEVVYGKGATYEYTSSNGNKLKLSEKYHKRVQSGIPLTYRNNKGVVDKHCAYSIVGFRGQTLKEPVVVKKADTFNYSPVVAPTTTKISITGTKEVLLQALFPENKIPSTTLPSTGRKGTKAELARDVMRMGYDQRLGYEAIISAIMHATGHDRQLARSYYKNNIDRVGIPATYA